MTIETKYNIGEKVYFFLDDEWWAGEIESIRTNGVDIRYEIANIPGYLMGYTRLSEADISTEKPEGFDKINDFVGLFPELNDGQKRELITMVRNLRKEAAKQKLVGP